jgi:hypothetical protein
MDEAAAGARMQIRAGVAGCPFFKDDQGIKAV